MGPLIAFLLAIMLMPVLMQLTGRSKRANALLQKSFAQQTALIHGVQVPALRLSVLHRWSNNAITSRHGDLIQVDANWLCRADDGQYVVAIAQSSREPGERVRFSWRNAPVRISWTWRSLSEDNVRNMLAGEPAVYRRVFG